MHLNRSLRGKAHYTLEVAFVTLEFTDKLLHIVIALLKIL